MVADGGSWNRYNHCMGRESTAQNARYLRATLRVSIRFLGPAADWAGRREETVELANDATLADIVRIVHARHRAIADAGDAVRWAVNAEFAAPDTPIHDGDEIAIVPPVSGG